MAGKVMVAALLLGMWAGGVAANPPAPVLVETDAAAIVQQQTEIRRDVQQRSGRYRDMAGADRDRLLVVQDRVLGKLEGRTTTTELSQLDQIALFNDLEEISALVNKAEDDRMVCERTRPIGTNRPVSVCKTVAERRAERERSQRIRDQRDARCEGGCPSDQNPNPQGAWR